VSKLLAATSNSISYQLNRRKQASTADAAASLAASIRVSLQSRCLVSVTLISVELFRLSLFSVVEATRGYIWVQVASYTFNTLADKSTAFVFSRPYLVRSRLCLFTFIRRQLQQLQYREIDWLMLQCCVCLSVCLSSSSVRNVLWLNGASYITKVTIDSLYRKSYMRKRLVLK